MIRPVRACIAACLATGLLVAAAPAVAAQETPGTPFTVSVDSLTPSTIPSRGTVTVTGRITNRSRTTWTDVNVYLLTSSEPMTTAEEVAEANATPAELEVGARITREGLFATLGDVEPGETRNYRLTVPRSALPVSGEAGVYWLGVHVLGASPEGRDSIADGRARTFLPLMREAGPRADLTLMVPVKARVRRNEDGTLHNLERWQEMLGSNGRLDRLLDLGATAFDAPVTWLVDPAVLEAAVSVARDNPPLDISPTRGEGASDPSPSALPSPPDPTQPPSDEPSPDAGEGEERPTSPQARQAAAWLASFQRISENDPVLAVPYGDVDVSSVFRADFGRIHERAVDLSRLTLDNLGISAEDVVAPSSGFLSNDALDQLDSDVPVILSDQAAPAATASLLRSQDGNPVVLTSSAAGAGGPAPTPRFAAIAVRQRVLAEAAVHALAGREDPLVVKTPEVWNPGVGWRTSGFFSGLDVPWLSLVDLPPAIVLGPDTDEVGPLVYSREQRRRELPTANLLVSDELTNLGTIYEDLLTRNDTVDDDLARIAMLAASTRARDRPHPALLRARAVTTRVHEQLRRVRIEGPPFVTMSSEEGTFAVTIVNDLDEPVTVGVNARTSSDELAIASPDPVDLGPGQRASVRLNASARNIGVHSVTLVPTTVNGQPLGASTKFSVRSSQVGLMIWAIMGAGAVVLFAASGVRITRRVRSHRHHEDQA